MGKIAYKTSTGQAHDLRFVCQDYVPETDEIVIDGDRLPDITTLHSPAYLENLFSESQRKADLENAKNTIGAKYKDKKKSDITDADALEWMKVSMALKLGLEL